MKKINSLLGLLTFALVGSTNAAGTVTGGIYALTTSTFFELTNSSITNQFPGISPSAGIAPSAEAPSIFPTAGSGYSTFPGKAYSLSSPASGGVALFIRGGCTNNDNQIGTGVEISARVSREKNYFGYLTTASNYLFGAEGTFYANDTDTTGTPNYSSTPVSNVFFQEGYVKNKFGGDLGIYASARSGSLEFSVSGGYTFNRSELNTPFNTSITGDFPGTSITTQMVNQNVTFHGGYLAFMASVGVSDNAQLFIRLKKSFFANKDITISAPQNSFYSTVPGLDFAAYVEDQATTSPSEATSFNSNVPSSVSVKSKTNSMEYGIGVSFTHKMA